MKWICSIDGDTCLSLRTESGEVCRFWKDGSCEKGLHIPEVPWGEWCDFFKEHGGRERELFDDEIAELFRKKKGGN